MRNHCKDTSEIERMEGGIKEVFEAWLQLSAANSPIGYIGILQWRITTEP